MTMTARRALLVGVPVLFAAILWLHPVADGPADLGGKASRFVAVHAGMTVLFCVMALAVYVLLDGLGGRAARVARLTLIPFVMFYVPYIVFEGLGGGVLAQEVNALAAAPRDAVSPELLEDFARDPIVGEPSVFWALGSAAWLVVVTAVVLAFRRAGAPLAVQVLLALSALAIGHVPPIGPVGLLAFAAAGVLVLRGLPAPTLRPLDVNPG